MDRLCEPIDIIYFTLETGNFLILNIRKVKRNFRGIFGAVLHRICNKNKNQNDKCMSFVMSMLIMKQAHYLVTEHENKTHIICV